MRRFELYRDGESGPVATGIEFDDGKATVRFRARHRGLHLWDSVDAIMLVHGRAGTWVRWID